MDEYYEYYNDGKEVSQAKKIVFDIISELNGRRGMGIESADDEIQEEILETLIELTENNIKEKTNLEDVKEVIKSYDKDNGYGCGSLRSVLYNKVQSINAFRDGS